MAYVQRPNVVTAWTGDNYDYFGRGCAISADALVLLGVAYGSGRIFVFDWDAGTSEYTPRDSPFLPPNPASEVFRGPAALSNTATVLVALVYSGATNSSRVVTYDWSGSAWIHRSAADIGVDLTTSSVSLSGAGSILTVGLRGAGADAAVDTYDWSGSAWVQRGTRLTIPAASVDDGLPYTQVELSRDGIVLAVGIQGRVDSIGNPDVGAVATFDVSGSTWIKRGSDLLYPDAVPPYYSKFGRALALSSDGSKLAVGALEKVYEYDVSGSTWTLGAATIVASDAAIDDNFGISVALNGTGSVLVVGADSWEGFTGDARGGLYLFDGEVVVPPPTGQAVAPTRLTVAASTGQAVAPTRLTVSASGQAVAPTRLAVIDLSQPWPRWSLRCTIDGIDVSAALTGLAEVEAEEGAARVASVVMRPAPGAINPLDYVGKSINIDYVELIGSAAVARRVFTGRIDTPLFDVDNGLLRLSCVDDLQNKVAALDRDVIDALCGGLYSTAVQGDLLDNWDYAGAVMSTVAGSLDAGAMSNLRVTPWELSSTWATFGDADLLYASSSLAFPQRSTLINSVEATFEYRYSRLRQRYGSIAWSGTQIDMAPNGYAYPTQADILGAASGSGWQVVTGVFYPAPAAIAHSSGGFIYPADDAIDLAILSMAQRHGQTVTETYSLNVSAPESVAINGALPHGLRGALEDDFDARAWESALDVDPLMPSGGEMDWAPNAPRADADAAIEVLLQQARVKILSTHRGARVGNAMLCNPGLDLDKRVAIATSSISASGKVARVRHRFDLAAGSAITEFEIACFGVGGAGILTPDTLAPPPPPPAAVETQDWPSQMPVLAVSTFGVTPYQDGLMGLLLNTPATITVSDVPSPDGPQTVAYPNPFYAAGEYPVTGFRVQMPGVDDADRNPITTTRTSDYSLVVPTDPLSITVS